MYVFNVCSIFVIFFSFFFWALLPTALLWALLPTASSFFFPGALLPTALLLFFSFFDGLIS